MSQQGQCVVRGSRDSGGRSRWVGVLWWASGPDVLAERTYVPSRGVGRGESWQGFGEWPSLAVGWGAPGRAMGCVW